MAMALSSRSRKCVTELVKSLLSLPINTASCASGSLRLLRAESLIPGIQVILCLFE
jgi:hypothetical protein